MIYLTVNWNALNNLLNFIPLSRCVHKNVINFLNMTVAQKSISFSINNSGKNRQMNSKFVYIGRMLVQLMLYLS